MRSIGLRASPKTVWFAVVDRPEPTGSITVLTKQGLPVPPALTVPGQLRFVRQNIADIIEEYGARRAGIRLGEPIAERLATERLNIEGVLQELLASSSVEAFFFGAIAEMGRHLKVKARSDVKKLIDGEDSMHIEGWSGFKIEERESVLAAVAALAIVRQ